MPGARRRRGVALAALACLLLVTWLARWSPLRARPDAAPPRGPSAVTLASAAGARADEVLPPADEARPVERSAALPAPAALPRAAASGTDAERFEVRVVDGASRPVDGARIELRALGAAGELLAEGLSDEHGLWRGPLPELGRWHLLELRLAELSLCATAPGFGLAARRLSPFDLHVRREPLVLTLTPGQVLRGRVLAPAGAPVAGALVTLDSDLSGSSGRPGASRLAQARSDAHGAFELSVGSAAGPLRLEAREPSTGVCRSEPFELVGEAPRELRLEPRGLLSGKVAYADGLPAAGLLVQARARGGGTTRGFARCDSEGRFAFASLDPGTYLLDVCGEDLPPARADEPGTGFTTPATGIALTSARAGLCVRVRASDGTLLRDAPVTCRRLAAEPDGSVGARERASASTAGEPPVATFELAAGERYVVAVELPGCHRAQAAVDASDPARAEELVLEAHARDRLARLQARFDGPPSVAAEDVRVDVYDPYSRLCTRRGLECDAQAWLPDLEPGAWLLRARRAGRPAQDRLAPGEGVLVRLRPADAGLVRLAVE